MPKPKTTLYHSELVQLGELECFVKTPVMPSKFGGKPPYVILEIDGQARTYSTENVKCEDAFEGLEGHRVLLIAEGRDRDAIVTILEDLGAESRPADRQPPRGQSRQSRESRRDTRPPPQEERRSERRDTRPPPREETRREQYREERPPVERETYREPEQQREPEPEPPKETAEQMRERLAKTAENNLHLARIHANRNSNLMLLCWQTAKHTQKQIKEQCGDDLGIVQVKEMATTFYIEMTKGRFKSEIDYVGYMPTGILDIKPKAPAPPEKQPNPTEPAPKENAKDTPKTSK